MLGLDKAVVLLDKEIADSCCDACQQERAIATFGYWQAIDGGRHRTKVADEHTCGPVRAAVRNVALAVFNEMDRGSNFDCDTEIKINQLLGERKETEIS